MSTAKEQRQGEYLRIVAETGSLVQARRRVGVTSKTVANWRVDPEFVEAAQDALDVAHDAIRAKVRELALAGDGPMLALSMKVIEPALQARATQVAVGVKVGRESPDLGDAEMVARINTLIRDVRMRQAHALPAPAVVDVEPDERLPMVDIEDLP